MGNFEYHHRQWGEHIDEIALALAIPDQKLIVIRDEFLAENLAHNTNTFMVEDTADELIKWMDLSTRPILVGIKDNGEKKKKRNRRVPPLIFQFIRDLLRSRKYCPGIICWLDYERKIFRFRDPKKVAQLWGVLKDNPRMTYAKFTRAIRYHYESDKKDANARVLFRSYPDDTVYQFGPDATGL